ncbi:hypothetical protein AKJ13_29405 [Methylobacterium sp. ARG-1]|nr:hypothetical protein AKJ13_29405 [Methylobacterium sp. ARG-1]
MPESQTSGDRAARADSDVVKVTTRLTQRQARAMKVLAAQQGVSVEDAYSAAVDAYLRGF